METGVGRGRRLPRMLGRGSGLVLLALVVFPLLDPNPYHLRVATSAALYVVLVLGLNVVVGLAGLLDLGYIGFYAIGAYTCALLASPHLGVHLGFWTIVPLGMGLAALAGVLLGIPVLRLKGDYLAIVTLGFGEIIRILLTNLDRPFNLTNGPNGIIRIDSPRLGGHELSGPVAWYFLIVGLALSVCFVFSRLDRSRPGLAWKALRDDPMGAQACGIDPVKYKLAAFATGAAMAGAAGVFFASWQGAVFPQTFSMVEVVTIFCMMVLGGVGNPLGAAVGAVSLVALPELLRAYSSYRMLIYGLLLIVMMQLRPGGLVPARPRHVRTSSRSADREASSGASAHPERGAKRVRAGPVLLRVEGVKKRFGGVVALDGVSLQLRAGEVLAVIGPNGAGKSTLIDVISGYLTPDDGKVQLLDGTAPPHGTAPSDQVRRPGQFRRMAPHRLARLGLARTFQNPRLFLSLTAGENLMAGEFASTDGRSRPAEGPKDPRWPSLCPASLFPSLAVAPEGVQTAGALTYADRRKVEVLRALAGRPRLLMLDEPAAGMTEEEVRELCDGIEALAASGLAVLLIEHRMEVVRRCAHRVVAMAGGQCLAEGVPEEVLSHPEVVRSYLGESVPASPARPVPVDPPGRGPGGSGSRPPVLEVANLVAGYGNKPVLQGVDMKINEGELVCLLGANGAGKSTLVKAIFGMARVFEGRIGLLGRSVLGRPPEEVVRAGAALVPEGRRIFSRLTVAENLDLGIGPGRETAEREKAMERVFTLFPRLAERRHQKAGSLSGGEQQMLAMARALVSCPRLLCLDEPTMGLSPLLATSVLDHVAEINAQGTAVLLVEQAARAAVGLAPRTYVLRAGKVVFEGDLAGAGALKEIEAFYLR